MELCALINMYLHIIFTCGITYSVRGNFISLMLKLFCYIENPFMVVGSAGIILF